MASKDISRDEWVTETKRLAPSDMAADAYIELSQFISEHTPLVVTYRRDDGSKSKSKYATFNGSVGGRLSLIQIYAGKCSCQWHWRTLIPGVADDTQQEMNEVLAQFRDKLGGTPSQRFETVRVLRVGVEEVESAIQEAAENLNTLLGDARKL